MTEALPSHPSGPALADMRRRALDRLRRQFPGRCLADREDAVQQALLAGLRLGCADNRRAVFGWAARMLLGTTRSGGVVRSARSAATSRAGPALPGGLRGGDEAKMLPPAEWIDSSIRAAVALRPEAALDAAARGFADPADLLPDAIALACRRGATLQDLARAAGTVKSTIIYWRDGRSRPRDPDEALEAVLRTAHDLARRDGAEKARERDAAAAAERASEAAAVAAARREGRARLAVETFARRRAALAAAAAARTAAADRAIAAELARQVAAAAEGRGLAQEEARRRLEEALRSAGGNATRAAAALKISRTEIGRRMAQLGIERQT